MCFDIFVKCHLKKQIMYTVIKNKYTENKLYKVTSVRVSNASIYIMGKHFELELGRQNTLILYV